jgi:hypothetical protein
VDVARQRILHPDFFTDADLLSLPPLHRLLFAGLWCLADREGRLLDRPRDLKLRILPADKADVDAMLHDLASLGMVLRYEVDGVRCLQVAGFDKYQKPHPRETQSLLPRPADVSAENQGGREKANLGEPKANLGEPTRPSMSSLPSVSVSVSVSDSVSETVEKQGPAGAAPSPLVAAWLELCPGLPQWQESPSSGRRKALRRAEERRPVEEWRTVFARIAKSRFCAGENDRGWKADLDWALRPEGAKPEPAACVLEGKYDGRGKPPAEEERGCILLGVAR